MIEVLTSGALNSLQDAGRFGYLDAGVSHAGVMDRLAYQTGNAMLGNQGDEACIEVAYFPFRLRFLAEAAFAVTGADCAARLDGVPLPPDWCRRARAGQELRLEPPVSGARAYVGFAGGVEVAPVLGSRSTDAKGGFGGLDGRGLRRGDRLALGQGQDGVPESGFGAAGFGAAGETQAPVLRVLPAAEFADFTDEARATLVGAEWLVTAEANRTGYRLSGPLLELTHPMELFSHGLMPGTVQVPPSGQPIVQLADANTCGGYPKIATVIRADLPLVAQAQAGAQLRFALTDRATARAALRAQADWVAGVRAAADALCGRSE